LAWTHSKLQKAKSSRIWYTRRNKYGTEPIDWVLSLTILPEPNIAPWGLVVWLVDASRHSESVYPQWHEAISFTRQEFFFSIWSLLGKCHSWQPHGCVTI
jgi:hypothetical protein